MLRAPKDKLCQFLLTMSQFSMGRSLETNYVGGVYDVDVIRFEDGEIRAPMVSRMSMCAMSTMSSIEDVFVNIAMARPKISLRVGRCGR